MDRRTLGGGPIPYLGDQTWLQGLRVAVAQGHFSTSILQDLVSQGQQLCGEDEEDGELRSALPSGPDLPV